MPRRILEGNVVSAKTDKTVTVLVERRYMHPVYKKYVRRTDKYLAHDDANAFGVGDRVQIEECRPISKRKKWKVITSASAASGRPVVAAPVAGDEAPAKAKKAKAMKKDAPPVDKAEKAEKAPAKKPAAKKAAKKKDAEE